jgi:general stress protein 26
VPTDAEIEAKFWKALKSDRTLMLGLYGTSNGHPRPMTAQFENARSPIWFFASTDNELIASLDGEDQAIATFASKGHDLFATLHGRLGVDNNRIIIDRFWNHFVAGWFEGGKNDPKLALLRFDAERAEIWLDDSSMLAGIKVLLGIDPKEDYRDKSAKVDLA